MINFSQLDADIILIDDEQSELDAYSFLLQSMGVQRIKTVNDCRFVMETLAIARNAIVFLDLTMPYKPGELVLSEILESYPDTPVVICTANSNITMAVKCLKRGAHDYLVKPVNINTFGSALRNAYKIIELNTEILNLKGIPQGEELRSPHHFEHIITSDPIMYGIFHYIESISSSGQPILILGETGSGKEMIARSIHDASGLEGEFVSIDVSGLDDTLFSDTLFGHEAGAYTGAETSRPGLLERARGGSIFLDEVGDLSKPSQIKLLRLIQEGVYYPLGSDTPRKCYARVITATNMELNQLSVQNDTFRTDLYYRLSTHLIRLPPLRKRIGDIPLLLWHFTQQAAQDMGKQISQIDDELKEKLEQHSFPGNVRELKSYIFDAVSQSYSDVLNTKAVLDRLAINAAMQSSMEVEERERITLASLFGHFPTLAELNEYAIDNAIEISNYNQSKAAELLGITRQALNQRLQRKK